MFLESVDVVVYAGVPCYSDLLEQCRTVGKPVVKVPKDYLLPASDEEWSKFDELVRLGKLTEQANEEQRLLQPS
jgi:hypothetical protein